ncbi:unnamed protein product, partial [Allacma fusca]
MTIFGNVNSICIGGGSAGSVLANRLSENFTKSENYRGEWDNERYHSHGGNLDVREPPYKALSAMYCKAAEEMGIPRKDLNADFIEGCSPIYNTQQHVNGRRHDT